VVGWIGLGRKKDGLPYRDEEIEGVSVVASYASLILENARLYEALKDQVGELISLQEVLSEMLASPYQLDALLDNLLEALKAIFPQRRLIEICLWDDDNQEMEVYKIEGEPSLQKGFRYRLGEGLTGWIASHRRPLLIRDVRKLKGLAPVDPALTKGFRSFIGVPLLTNGKLVGTLELDSSQPDAFGVKDLRFLEAMTPKVAALIENARRFQLSRKERDALLTAYRLLGTLLASDVQEDEVFAFLAEKVVETMKVDACLIETLEDGNLVPQASWGLEGEMTSKELEEEVLKTGYIVSIPDLDASTWAGRNFSGMRAFMGAPIWVRGETRGVISIWKEAPYEFAYADRDLLLAFAFQASVTLERRELVRELHERIRALSALNAVTTSLHRLADLDELLVEGLNKTLELLSPLGECYGCVLVFQEKGPLIKASPQFPLPLKDALASLDPTGPLRAEEAESVRGRIEEILAAHSKHHLLVPLTSSDRVWGFLMAVMPKHLVYPPFCLEAVFSIGNQIGVAVERVFLFKRLKGERDRFKKALYEIADGVYTVDVEGRIKEFSEGAETKTGWKISEVRGRYCGEIFQAEGGKPPIAIEAMGTAVRGGEKYVRVSRRSHALTKGGKTFPIAEIAAPLLDEEEGLTGAIVAFWDLTEEEKINRLREDFISVVSHQFKTPLNRIKCTADVILDPLGSHDLEACNKGWEKVREEVESLNKLVDEMILVSKLEAGEGVVSQEPLDMVQMVEKIVADLRSPKLFPEHRWEVKAPARSLWAMGQRSYTEMVLRNLLENAAKYSPQGSLITIEMKECEDEVWVSVVDRGKGIPAHYLDRIFDKFFRVEEGDNQKAYGHGLGLYVSKLLVEIQGGRIWAESELNKGSRFTFTLPKAISRAESS